MKLRGLQWFFLGLWAAFFAGVVLGVLMWLAGCSGAQPPPEPPGPCASRDGFCDGGTQGRARCDWIDDNNVCLRFESYELHYAYTCMRGWHLVSDTGCPRFDGTEERAQ